MQILKFYDIFCLPDNATDKNIVCVTTNGIMKKDGNAVMGAGIAKTANQRFHVATKLAQHLQTNGNVVGDLGTYQWKNSSFHLVSFPTKEHWNHPSIPKLIEQSAKQLVMLADNQGFERIYLTPPGCGMGKLDWENDVKPILEPLFDDRFVVVFR